MVVQNVPYVPYVQNSGLGEFDVESFLGGASIPVMLIGALLLGIFLFGEGAQMRRSAISEENRRHREAIKSIKRKYRRMPIGAYYET